MKQKMTKNLLSFLLVLSIIFSSGVSTLANSELEHMEVRVDKEEVEKTEDIDGAESPDRAESIENTESTESTENTEGTESLDNTLPDQNRTEEDGEAKDLPLLDGQELETGQDEMLLQEVRQRGGLKGSIVDIDTQYTQDRYDEVKDLNQLEAKLTAWKNDKVHSEIVVISESTSLEKLSISATDLVSDQARISSDNIEISLIQSTKAYYGDYLGYGDATRPLPPVTATNRKESNDILNPKTDFALNPESFQPIWVQFCIPSDAVAGEYKGKIEVQADHLSESLQFDYTINVQEAQLPDASDFAQGFDIEMWQYPYSSAEYYKVKPFSADHMEILRSSMQIYKEMGGHAITASIVEEAWSGQTYSQNPLHYPSMIKWIWEDGSFRYDYADFDAWVSLCREMGLGDKIVLYSIAPWNSSIGYWENGVLNFRRFNLNHAQDQNLWRHFLKDLISHLTERGWFEAAYIGIDERNFSKQAFDLIDSVTNEENQALKTAGAMDNFVNKWDLAMRVTDLSVGDTAAAEHAEDFARLVEARDDKGYTTTLYSCTEHQPGQFSLSAPVESYWAIANAGKMKTTGFLRWAYDAWVENPLADATHNAFEPGDCFFVYPDEKDSGQRQTRKSVRLERLAEGVRDMNKLLMMEKEIPQLKTQVEDAFAVINAPLKIVKRIPPYLSKAEIDHLRNQVNIFKAKIAAITNEYIRLKQSGTNDIESISILQGSEISMDLGQSKELRVEFRPDNVLNTGLDWQSSKPRIVSVNAKGKITGLKEGQAVIRATSTQNQDKQASIVVKVKGPSIDQSKRFSYYSFDQVEENKIIDTWGSRNGTLLGELAPGKDGQALLVSAAEQGMTFEQAHTLGSNWSVGYWIKTTADFSGQISELMDQNKDFAFSLKMAKNRQGGFRVGKRPGDVLTYKYNFEPNRWYHMTWVQDKKKGLSLYVNGQLVETNRWTASNPIKAPVDIIGGIGFTGLIDDLKIYKDILSPEEILVSLKVKGLRLPENEVKLYLGEKYEIQADLVTEDEDKTLLFISENPEIATVDEEGVVYGKAKGTTEITVRHEPSGYEEKLRVEVSKFLRITNTLPVHKIDEKYLSDVDKPTDPAKQYLGQPDMVRTKTGRLITVYPQGHGKGPLIMQVSEDNGKTWTKKTDTPLSWEGSQETPTLYTLKMKDGKERIILITACPGWGVDSAGNATGWNTSYSDDNGETWNEYTHWHTNLPNGNPNKSIVAMASLVQLKDDKGNWIEKWLGVYHDYDYVNYKTYLTFDQDGREEWTEPVPYLSQYRGIEALYQMCEIGMFRSPDGNKIVGLARSQSHNNPATLIYSEDEGEIWSKPMDLPGTLAGERHKAFYDPISGRLLITFREIRYDLNGNNQFDGFPDWTCDDWGLWVGTFDDLLNQNEGQYRIRLAEDWTNNTKSGDTGYTGVAVLEDGTFVLHSYGHWDKEHSLNWPSNQVTKDLCYIKQAKFKLGDLENDFGFISRTELNKAILEADKLKEADYLPDTWRLFKLALDQAKDINMDHGSAQIQVDHAKEALKEAIKALKRKTATEVLPPFVPETTNSSARVNQKEETIENDTIPLSSVTSPKDFAFVDVPLDSWYKESLAALYNADILLGVDQTHFAPESHVNRAMLPTVLYRMSKDKAFTRSNPFVDVKDNTWYYEAVLWASEKGYVEGYNHHFMPDQKISREDLVVILYRFANSKVKAGNHQEITFKDEAMISDYAKEAIRWAAKNDLVKGLATGDLAPKKWVTRAEMAEILYRLLKKMGQ